MTALKSIKSRILAFSILATILPSVGLGLLTYWRYQDLVGENVTVELRTLGNYVRSELGLWIRGRVDDLRAVSSANTILDGLAARREIGPRQRGKGGQAAAGIEAYIRAVQGKLGSTRELTVFDAGGKRVASSSATPTPVDLPAAWTERGANDGIFQHPPRRAGEDDAATITVVVPILLHSDGFAGALSAVLDLAGLEPRLRAIAKVSGAEVLLLAPGGTPLIGTRGGSPRPRPIASQALHQLQSRTGEPLTYVGHRGQEVIGLAATAGPSSISIVAERETADVYLERRMLLELFAGLTGALTLVVGVLAYWIGRSIVTPLDDLVGAVDVVAAGNLDVHLDPCGGSEIGRLTQAVNKMAERLRDSRGEVEAANEALHRQNRLLEAMSVTDGLTGLNNRKRLDAILVEQIALSRRYRRPFAVVMLDLDHFKALNDSCGHLAGDRMLENVAGILKRCVRSVDHVARYGGEEFAVVLVEATLQGALDTAERIRASVEASSILVDDRPVCATVSLGVTRSRASDTGPEDLLARADAALYEAKHSGRNRVHCADAVSRAEEKVES